MTKREKRTKMSENHRRYQIELINNETGEKKTTKVSKVTFAEAASHAYILQHNPAPEKYRISSIVELGNLKKWLNL